MSLMLETLEIKETIKIQEIHRQIRAAIQEIHLQIRKTGAGEIKDTTIETIGETTTMISLMAEVVEQLQHLQIQIEAGTRTQITIIIIMPGEELQILRQRQIGEPQTIGTVGPAEIVEVDLQQNLPKRKDNHSLFWMLTAASVEIPVPGES